jgi:hypothetical protein
LAEPSARAARQRQLRAKKVFADTIDDTFQQSQSKKVNYLKQFYSFIRQGAFFKKYFVIKMKSRILASKMKHLFVRTSI